MKAISNYKPTKWDESSIKEISSEMKINKVSAVFTFEGGEIEGEGAVEYLMFYSHFDPNDLHTSSAKYVGLIRMNGKLNGHAGTFVMSDSGTFENGALTSTLTIIKGSGTDGLQQISGTAKYYSNGKAVTMEIDYEV